MVEELYFDTHLKERINYLVQLKSGKNESYIHPKEEEINQFIEAELFKADEKRESLGGRKDKDVNLDAFFRYGLKTYWK